MLKLKKRTMKATSELEERISDIARILEDAIFSYFYRSELLLTGNGNQVFKTYPTFRIPHHNIVIECFDGSILSRNDDYKIVVRSFENLYLRNSIRPIFVPPIRTGELYSNNSNCNREDISGFVLNSIESILRVNQGDTGV